MSRRARIPVVALLALTLILQVPSAFAARSDSDPFDRDFGSRIVRVLQKIVKIFKPSGNDYIAPPKP